MTQKQAVLQALKDAGAQGVTNGELTFGLRILRYAARICELREDGHTIRTVREDGSRVRFILEQPASVPTPDTPAREVAADALFEPPPEAPRNALFDDWEAA